MSKPKRCRICKRITKHRSKTGRCKSCSMNKCIVVVKQLRAKKGKIYKKWLRNTLAGLKKKS